MGSYYYSDPPPINPFLVPYPFPPPTYDSPEKEFCSFITPSFSSEGPWPYGEPPINPSPVPYSFPPPTYDSPEKEFCSFITPSFSFSPEGPWPYGEPPINPSPVPYSFPPPTYDSPEKEFWSLHCRLMALPVSDALIVNKPCEGGLNEPCADAYGNKPAETLYGKTITDGCGESNGKLTTVESMGSAAGAHNWNSKENSSESKAAWNTSGGKDTEEGGAAAEYHNCEELSGRGSCGNACCTCAEADHLARKCTLGADCGWSGHHSGGNSTIQD